MSDRYPTTASGLKKMQEELKHLESVERPKISSEIGIARAHGDLRENAEYHAAKEKQGYIEGRILTLNAWIGGAEVIDVTAFKGQKKVLFGASVQLLDCETDKKVSYRIVGEFEADLKKRWISVNSPVARGLIGKVVGDIATIQSPGGNREYEVLSVDFEDGA
ncbi:MAG: transcription elongation factor GreA [Archangium sp.]|nr:transcription elongation factor GreA [Archangium sp.]MDP3152937.1 transcription elongation factor GreA [Archangium sp.]MDP3569905.1 transcription elongation factor GreA [Archangium sp.]